MPPSAIWKFTVPPYEASIPMPAGARTLSTAFQGYDLQVWAEVDPAAPYVRRRIRVVGTGWLNQTLDGAFIGTAFNHPAGLVFHVFDLGEVTD